MKIIDEKIEHIHEEIEGAKEYSEKYIKCKSKGNIEKANKYKEMAHDEIRHANMLKDWAVADIEDIKTVYTIPVEDMEKWEHHHKKFDEHIAIIKQMLMN